MSVRTPNKKKLGSSLIVAMLFAFAFSFVSAPAEAARPAKSQRQLKRAKALLKTGDYRKAAKAARTAYDVDGDPKHVLWLARIYARANRMKLARGTLKRYKALRRAQKRRDDEYAAIAKIRKRRVKQGKWPKPKLSDIIVKKDETPANKPLQPFRNVDARHASLKRGQNPTQNPTQ
jgi:hypothetical protein